MSTQVKFKMHEGGFFSNFNKVITFLYEHSEAHADMPVTQILWDFKGQPFGAFAYNIDDVFGSVFHEYGEKEKNFNTKMIVDNYSKKAFNQWTGMHQHNLYTSADKTWRHKWNKIYKEFIIPNAETKSYLKKIDNKKEFNGKLISVLKRNQLLKCEQKAGIMPSIERYFKEIDKIIDDETYLYLCVDNINDLNAFIKRYKKCIYHPHMRRTEKDTDQEPHFTPSTEKDALHTFVDLYGAAKAQRFIHPVSNMATAALYINPEMESIYLYE